MLLTQAQKVKKEKETTNAKKQRTSAPVVKDMRLSETIGTLPSRSPMILMDDVPQVSMI